MDTGVPRGQPRGPEVWAAPAGPARPTRSPDPQLRTRDASYFRALPRARGYLARIRPTQPTHRGTFCCAIQHDQRPLARLYFFLNGAGGAGGRGPGAGPGRGGLTPPQ